MQLKSIFLSAIAFSVSVASITSIAASNLPAPESALPSPKISTQPIDQIVATVNDGIITQSEVNTLYKRALKQITKSGKVAPNKSTLKNEILNQIIYKKLQLQMAKRAGLTVTEAQINIAIASIAKQHKTSSAGLMQKVSADGFTSEQYRKEIREQILMSMLQHQALAKDVSVTNADVSDFLKQYQSQGKYATRYQLVDLRIPLPAASTRTQAKKANAQALNIIKQLRNGADAYKIAGVQVNSMGWGTLSTIPDLFARQLNDDTSIGNIVGPVRAGNGYHIVIVKNIKKSKLKLPSRDQVKQILFRQKINKALGKWLTKLRNTASVKILKAQ
jgi:peptidyl-prolyl cis-trans isomerase SurA